VAFAGVDADRGRAGGQRAEGEQQGDDDALIQ
jgi:hypothetical protein